MTWALGITFEEGKFVTEIMDEDGHPALAELNKLSTRGTMAHSCPSRKKGINTTFSDWKRTSSSEYLKGRGVTLPRNARCQHTVFEFRVRQTRFLVPALAVMRALFRPSKHLLPTMFLPQALDRVSFIDFSAGTPTLTVDASWAGSGYRCMNQQVHDVLQWMCCAPSARTMAGSVHTAALRGRLDLTLPLGEARISVYGTKIGDTYFASDITVQHIETTECTRFDEADPGGKVHFQNQDTCAELNLLVPTRAGGQPELTDEEWERVGPILISNMAKGRLKLNQRDLFDGVLTKLSTQQPWKKISYKSGTKTHAQHAYRSWTRTGALQQALAVLSAMREPSAATLKATLGRFA